MTRAQEMSERHRWSTAVRGLVLFGLTLGVLGYLILPGCQKQAPTRSVEAYCQQIPAVTSFEQALTDLDPTAVRNAIPALDQLDQVAPTDIEPQLKIIVDTTKSLVSAVQDAQTDESAALDRAWRPKQNDVARIEAAGKAVGAYTLANCHIDLNTTVPTTKPDAGTAVGSSSTPAKPAGTAKSSPTTSAPARH